MSQQAEQLTIHGMSCASCVAHVEKALNRVEGVDKATVNLATEEATVTLSQPVSTSVLIDAVEKAGYDVGTQQIQLNIEGMSCASCVNHVEKALKKVPGVINASVNLATEKATVRMLDKTPVSVLKDAVSQAGYTATEPTQLVTQQKHHPAWLNVLVSAIFTLPLVLPMLLMIFGGHFTLNVWLQFVLATIVQIVCGYKFYISAWKSVRSGAANMDVLVAIGTTAAYGLSLYTLLRHPDDLHHIYFEASASVITLILLGKWLELRAKRKTTDAIRALNALRPTTAHLKKAQGEAEIAIDDILPGDIVIVKNGERIPVDGEIVEGESQVDESLITGESRLLSKKVGDQVVGGAMNQEGTLLVKTLKVGVETTLSRIIRLVENAQAEKAPIQRIVDKVSAVFVPVVLGIAFITFLGWLIYAGDWENALLNAVAVLVIACPCALGLATPTTIMAGTGVAARHGILIKDAQALELTHRITAVAFDKTGTITEGKPVLVHVNAFNHATEQEILQIAASIQQASSHPLAKAVLDKATEAELKLYETKRVKNLTGKGIIASANEGEYLLGSTRLLRESVPECESYIEEASTWLIEGKTISWLMQKHQQEIVLLGLLAFADQVKPSAQQAIARLNAMGIHTVMISGDNWGSANAVGQTVGIKEIKAEVLPEGKVEQINSLRQQGYVVAMVGDGINDAPALAAADVGIAMSTGTDVAMETAGITLMQGDLNLVAASIDISLKTYRKIKQNLGWAFIYNILGIPLAAFGLLNPMIAGAAMAFSSVSVVSNALLLKRWKSRV